jgi:hypothetical protein
MLVRALLICAVWLGIALWLDSYAMVAVGVVFAFLLAWRDEHKAQAASEPDDSADDAEYERQPPTLWL